MRAKYYIQRNTDGGNVLNVSSKKKHEEEINKVTLSPIHAVMRIGSYDYYLQLFGDDAL